MPSLPRVGDSVAASADDAKGEWVVTAVMHNLYDGRRVEIDIESVERGIPLSNMTRRDRVRMRKQLEKAGWTTIDETGAREK